MKQSAPPQSIARYLGLHLIMGCVIGLIFGLLMLVTDTAGIGALVTSSAYPVATVVLFLIASVISFVPIVLATAIGGLAE